MVISSLLSSGISSSSLVDQVRFLILLLIVTLIVALLSRRLRVPYTLLLVIVGFVVGILPFVPNEHIDPNLVLYVFIPALLFEGAWNAEIDWLEADWLPIILLATLGMVLSLLVVAVFLHFGIGLSWLLSLLVGAIVAPTDPVAVIALFQQLGGLLLGFGVGCAASRLLRRVDDRLVVITITVAVAYGMYLLGTALHTSGLLAVVGAVLVMGSYGRKTAMSPRTIETADDVWEFINYLANSLLFLLLGFELSLTHIAQSFPGIFFGLLGAIAGRALMIYTFLPLQDALAQWWASKAPEWRSRLPRSRPVPPAWRPVMVLSGMRALARPGAQLAHGTRTAKPFNGHCLRRDIGDAAGARTDLARAAASLERETGTHGGVITDHGSTDRGGRIMPIEMADSNFVKNAGGGMHMLHQPVGYECTGYLAPLGLEACYGYQAHN